MNGFAVQITKVPKTWILSLFDNKSKWSQKIRWIDFMAPAPYQKLRFFDNITSFSPHKESKVHTQKEKKNGKKKKQISACTVQRYRH
jgi:muramidase (phage lysozyme)